MAPADPKMLTKVKSITTKAINAAAIEHSKGAGGDVNRSTATRAAYKLKAEALDQIAELLGSKVRSRATSAKAPSNVRKKQVAAARRAKSSVSAKAAVRPRPKGTTRAAVKRRATAKR